MTSVLIRYLKIIGATLLGLGCFVAIAVWWQWDSVVDDFQVWRHDYQASALEKAMQTEVVHLAPVDEVEVILLADDPTSPGQKPFHQSVEREALKYEEKKVTLRGMDAMALAELWRAQVADRNGVNCHFPHHALRFLNHGKLISQTLICFHCQNAEIPCSIFGGELIVFDTTPQYAKLKKRLEGLVGVAP